MGPAVERGYLCFWWRLSVRSRIVPQFSEPFFGDLADLVYQYVLPNRSASERTGFWFAILVTSGVLLTFLDVSMATISCSVCIFVDAA